MFSFAMVLAPFDRGLSGQEKTTLVHGKTNTELIFGTKAGKLLRCHPNWRKCARSATCHHTSFPGNGGKARRTLPPSAVHSARPSLLPSHQPAALWERRKPSLTPLHLWFAALNLAQAYAPDGPFVKRANALFPLFTNAGGHTQEYFAI